MKTMTKSESSRHGGQKRTKDALSTEASRRRRSSENNWNRLRRMSDAEIRQGIASDPDARVTNADFWKDAKLVQTKS
jgi:hypothetical protein